MKEPDQILKPCSSGRRKPSNSNSPEFEFIGNPSFPQSNLLSADELFSDGLLLPLHKLNLSNEPHPPPPPPPPHQVPEPESSITESAELSASPRLTSSNRWMDIFKKTSRSSTIVNADDGNDKEKRREKNGFNASELNINIWPFSRSRSARNGGTRPRSAAATRKVSSAPCSRSNSAGESKSRKWPSGPGRATAGVHLGRSSPVWQVRRGGSGGGAAVSAGIRKYGNDIRRKTPPAASVGGGDKAKVLSFNVPVCMGYRHHFICRSEDNSAGGASAATGSGGVSRDISGEGVRVNNLFNIRRLFTKKIH